MSHGDYQAYLAKVYAKVSVREREAIVGNYRDANVYVDRNQVLLPRTLAHERLHQHQNEKFERALGSRLAEGTTEYLASQLYGDLGIPDLGKAYPEEQVVVGILTARAGDDVLARAYFHGDVGELRSIIDGDLGRGALETVARLVESRSYSEAQEVLKGRRRPDAWAAGAFGEEI